VQMLTRDTDGDGLVEFDSDSDEVQKQDES